MFDIQVLFKHLHNRIVGSIHIVTPALTNQNSRPVILKSMNEFVNQTGFPDAGHALNPNQFRKSLLGFIPRHFEFGSVLCFGQ